MKEVLLSTSENVSFFSFSSVTGYIWLRSRKIHFLLYWFFDGCFTLCYHSFILFLSIFFFFFALSSQTCNLTCDPADSTYSLHVLFCASVTDRSLRGASGTEIESNSSKLNCLIYIGNALYKTFLLRVHQFWFILSIFYNRFPH